MENDKKQIPMDILDKLRELFNDSEYLIVGFDHYDMSIKLAPKNKPIASAVIFTFFSCFWHNH